MPRFYKIEIVLSNTAVIISSSMRAFISAAAIAAFLIATLPAHAQTPDAGARDRLVVSPAWLAQHVNDPGLVLLHVGNKATYDAGHIAGARLVDYRTTLAVSPTPGDNAALSLEMLPADVMRD